MRLSRCTVPAPLCRRKHRFKRSEIIIFEPSANHMNHVEMTIYITSNNNNCSRVYTPAVYMKHHRPTIISTIIATVSTPE